MNTHQEKMLSEYQGLDPEAWAKPPLEWKGIQWHFWGTVFTDMSIGYGKYFKSFASNLKEYLKDDSLYLVCGNKDDLISLLLYLCKNDILPKGDEEHHIFKIRGNKYFERVTDLNLNECSFEGTRESELHFKIFFPLDKDFVRDLFENGLLYDSKKGKDQFFKVFQKRLPGKVVSNLNRDQKNALLGGMIDGDGSAGVMITCPDCKMRNTIRSEEFICRNCRYDLTDIVRSMDYNIMLDSGHLERLEDEMRFLVETMGLKGHIYASYVKKERPDKLSEERFDERVKVMDERMNNYKVLAKDMNIPLIINEHELKRTLPSHDFAPDVYGSIKFLFTPHFRSHADQLKWYGTTDIHGINLKIIKGSLDYLFIAKKRAVLNRVIINRNI